MKYVVLAASLVVGWALTKLPPISDKIHDLIIAITNNIRM